MIFCRTNVDCDCLEGFLNAHGGGKKFNWNNKAPESGRQNPYSCCVLAGMRSMNERRAALDAFKEGAVRFLICTDVAARGIDVKGLPFVINMTLPDVAEQ
jgi:ATP-dependent RNA helicase DDX1